MTFDWETLGLALASWKAIGVLASLMLLFVALVFGKVSIARMRRRVGLRD